MAARKVEDSIIHLVDAYLFVGRRHSTGNPGFGVELGELIARKAEVTDRGGN
jgi:hypothetical protein